MVVGQSTFATIGVLISGKPLKTAVSCGFSLTQIGEFAFIIAGLGLSLGVTGDFLYPIVVAVSVITIFITPYMIRLSEPAYRFLDRHLPVWLKGMLDRYASGGDDTPSDKSDTRKYISDFVKVILIHSIICIALLMISFNWLVPLVTGWIPGITGHIAAALLIVAVMSPFLYSILIRRTFSTEFSSIWAYSRVMRPALVGMVLVRIFVAMGFLLFVLFKLFQLSGIPVFLIAFGAVVLLVSSRSVRKQSIRIENTFRNNMKARDLSDELKGTAHTDNVNTLISHELHFADFTIPTDPEWDGKMLSELNLGNRFGVHVVAITCGHERVDFPRASDKIFAGDVVQIVATDSGIEEFGEALKTSSQK